jgi:hypothetical protein
MPLSFYLLKPVKQVTEYLLLMEKLLKQPSADHPGFCVVICRACPRVLPAKASEVSDRVPAAHGEAAEAVFS